MVKPAGEIATYDQIVWRLGDLYRELNTGDDDRAEVRMCGYEVRVRKLRCWTERAPVPASHNPWLDAPHSQWHGRFSIRVVTRPAGRELVVMEYRPHWGGKWSRTTKEAMAERCSQRTGMSRGEDWSRKEHKWPLPSATT